MLHLPFNGFSENDVYFQDTRNSFTEHGYQK
jgi:hypothetical protein